MVALARRSAFALSMTAAVWLAGLAAARPASAQDVLLHQQLPNRLFGHTSDTLAVNNFGQPDSQLVADRFRIVGGGTMTRIQWWGFYGGQFDEVVEQPPQTETFQIRFFEDQGGIPGRILYQKLIPNPPRMETGFEIAQGPLPPEFAYTLQLSTPFPALSDTDYWISIAQHDDVNSRFRWETATGGEFAAQHPVDSPWLLFSPGQLAYELWTPEPSTALLFITAMVAGMKNRRGRVARRRR